MGDGGRLRDVLFERGTETDAIEAAIGAACAGGGSALFIEGAAGIGKTRLLGYACERAAAAGMTVLSARAAEYEDGYAWGVVRQLFTEGQRNRGGGQHGGDAMALAGLALGDGARPGNLDEFAVLHGLYWRTADIAGRGPLLLAVDDLHWADKPSQRFAIHLTRRLEGLPVLLVVTVREPRAGTAQDKALTATLALEPVVVQVRPAPLSLDGCARLVTAQLGRAPAPAFASACQELTGGNPLLVRGLLAALAAEGATCDDADVPHLRRLTPDTVSRYVLLRLGRLPAPVLAMARAITVLGTSATTDRAARLAGLDPATAADAAEVLMAERLIEGDRQLRFVHPLVRSVVYTDLAAPVRQHWHKQAARLLTGAGAPAAEATTHLLAAAAEGDPMVTGQLRAAGADALARGAPEVAVQCLARALAEPPPPGDRAAVLHELGSAESTLAPDAALAHLTEALSLAAGWPLRGEISLALGEALALGGRFADAVRILRQALDESAGAAGTDGTGGLVVGLKGALLNIARWDLGTRESTWPLLRSVFDQAEGGAELDPQLHANLAIELGVAGTDAAGAVKHARAAVRATSQLMSLTATALPEAVSVLIFADENAEAWAAAQHWLRLAQQRGQPLATAIAASVASMAAHYGGDIQAAVSYGMQAIEGGNGWVPVMSTGLVVPAMVDAGELRGARSLLAAHGLLGDDLLPVWPFNVARYARGCVDAAAGDHEKAAADLLAAGDFATRWGINNPAAMPWRSAAALSLNALGDKAAAERLVAEEVELAGKWCSKRAAGVALRAAGIVRGGPAGIESLCDAVALLRQSPARLELARALADLGAAHRRAGNRGAARELLRESLDGAHALGGHAIAARAREELVMAGGRPRRDAIRGRDALTPSELRVAELAASGLTNRRIAQALFVTQRTVENHLTSGYAKLGIAARAELGTALGTAPGRRVGTLDRSAPAAEQRREYREQL
jgi:DNA-binding CsgD family transcriptional regulator